MEESVALSEVDALAASFVPRENVTGKGEGALLLKKRTTLSAAMIDKATSGGGPEAEHNTMLNCCLCKNVMIKPRECRSCRKGFCSACIDDYLNQLMSGDSEVRCPNCGKNNFKLIEGHPLLVRQLSNIKAKCENAEKGCSEVIAYDDLEKHQTECGYATVKCLHYGCEKELFQKDFEEHERACEHKVRRCDKCSFQKQTDDECNDCVKNLVGKCNLLEEKLIKLT